MRRSIVATATLLVFASPSAGFARTPEERFRELEQKILSLQQTYTANNQDIASTLARSQTIQEEFGVLKGQVESNRHLLSSQNEEQMRLINELDHRIQAIEDRLGIFSSQLSKALSKVAPEAAAEGDMYQKGLDEVNASKYLEASSTFETFIKKYSRSQFAADAQFWIGECFFSMRDYQRAIKEFQAFIDGYHRDPKVPDALLRQGDSFYELGMLDESSAFYEKVLQTYPTSTAAAKAQAKKAKIKERKAAKGGVATSSPLGSYPAETLEQKRMRLRSAPPTTDSSTSNAKDRKPRIPEGDF